ncbi:hypothetical protein ABBQ38_010264 [Trebouxia sp. C0009 RCD-2024]
MAAITVKREETGDIITFDTVAEVGSAAVFISCIEKVWGEGVLLKPSSTSVFTARTPQPFLHGVYTFLQKSGTAVSTTLHNSYLAACSTGSRPHSVVWCWYESGWFQLAAAIFALQQLHLQKTVLIGPVCTVFACNKGDVTPMSPNIWPQCHPACLRP